MTLIEDGLYILTATAGEKVLYGGVVALVYKNINSTVLGEWSPAVLGTAINNPPQGIYSVVLEWGKYPMFFTKSGVTSEAVYGLVYRMAPYEILAAGVPTGAYGITIFTNEENVNVQSEDSSVIHSNGTTLTSVKEGLGRWRVVHDNYIGPWYSSQVFADFSGDWYCADDNFGHNIKLRVPPVDPRVIYGGTIGNSLNIYQQYKQNSKSIAWAQVNLGIGQITNNISGEVSSPVDADGTCDFDVEIGPMPDCMFCNLATVPQCPAWGFGYLTLLNQNKHGSMIYSSPTKFFVSFMSTDSASFRDITFIKQPVVFTAAINYFTPVAAAPGGVVTIKACNANTVTSVSFGGVPATSFSIVDNATITAVVGQGNSGNVKITGGGGSSSLNGFTIILPAPTITSFTPTSAVPGSTVTISGTNFTGASSVTIGGSAAESFIVVNNTTITAVIASNATSGNVTVTTPSGQATKSGFTVLAPLRGTVVVNGISYNSSHVTKVLVPSYPFGWTFHADTTSAIDAYYREISVVAHGNDLRPRIGSYNLGDYDQGINYLKLNYTERDLSYNTSFYSSQISGTITITRSDTRCAGTFNNVKVYTSFGQPGNVEIILNGTFDVPIQ